MANEKLIAGAVMILLNLVVLAPIATSMVEDAVEDNFETYPYDSACADSDCTTAEEDWSTSTSERTYYAWNLTNVDEVMAGEEPVYQKVGPFLYDITTTRNILDFNESAGTLTYDESKSFSCSENSENDCNMAITQLNIPFQPQTVGATGMVVDGIMELTKVGFTAGVMAIELESFSAAEKTASDLEMSYMGIQAGGADAATASTMIATGWYDEFNDYFALINGSELNNMTGNGEMINYTTAIQGLQAQEAALGVNTAGVTFAGNASIGDFSTAFDSATFGTENAALTDRQGVLLLAGHCDAMPTENYDYASVSADLGNNPAFTTGVLQRAGVWGFLNPSDINATIAMDFAICFGAAGTFAMVNGGADDDWMTDPLAVDASTRIMNYLGVDIDNTVAMGLLLAGHGTDTPTGLFATSADGQSFGLAAFMGMEAGDAMATYGLDATQYTAIITWAGGWLSSVSELPLALLGGTGTLTAEQFVNITFGAEDPLNGGYLATSLNLGISSMDGMSYWEMMGGEAIDLTPEQSANILYNETLGLTTSTGATLFLFGELTGTAAPVLGGTPWNNQTVAALYGIEPTDADALRALVMTVYETMVPGQLMILESSGEYMTMPLEPTGSMDGETLSAQTLQEMLQHPNAWDGPKLETNETYLRIGWNLHWNLPLSTSCALGTTRTATRAKQSAKMDPINSLGEAI